MKILFVIWNYFPGIEGGSERQARQIAHELSHRGHSCAVLTAWQDPEWPRTDVQDGVTIIRFGSLAPWQNRCRRWLDRLHCLPQNILRHISPFSLVQYENFRLQFDFWVMLPITWITRWSFMRDVRKHMEHAILPDVVHLHEPSWLGGFAVQLFSSKQIPVLCQEATNPAIPVLGYDVPFRGQLEPLRKNAIFIAMAPYLAEDLILKHVSQDRIHVLPNGVTIPSDSSRPAESEIVLYVGNFSQGAHWKAFDVLFDAWARVHEQKPDARLVLLGGGDHSAWDKYTHYTNCSRSVDFTGRVSDPSLYYRQAAIFVLPSRVEGMSNALLEAQSWGLPCVVSDIPGNRAVVEHNSNGLVIPVGNAAALAEAVCHLLNSPSERTRLGIASRARAVERYSMPAVVDQLVALYQKVTDINKDKQ